MYIPNLQIIEREEHTFPKNDNFEYHRAEPKENLSNVVAACRIVADDAERYEVDYKREYKRTHVDYDPALVYFVLGDFVGIIEHCDQWHGDIQSVVKRS
jgi:hypothetical protein